MLIIHDVLVRGLTLKTHLIKDQRRVEAGLSLDLNLRMLHYQTKIIGLHILSLILRTLINLLVGQNGARRY